MGDSELADLAIALLIAGGLGLSLACAYLVREPAQRTFRIWTGAVAVGVPGFLVGLALSSPELGVRAAYLGLTEAILEEPVAAHIMGISGPEVARTPSGTGDGQTAPGLAPTAGEPALSTLGEPSTTGDTSPGGEPSPSVEPSPTDDPPGPPWGQSRPTPKTVKP